MYSETKTRLPIVGVMGSGSKAHRDRAGALGKWLAEEGVHLLTGGGGGVMETVSRAFYEVSHRKGLVIGILPGNVADRKYRPAPGYPNPWVEIPIPTHLPLSGTQGTDPMSRNHINILSSDVIVALPGSHGTASEVALAMAYGRPVIAYLDRRAQIDGLPDSARVEPDFKEIKTFVRRQIHTGD
ncbi:molybdenum cofactor carrier protein [Thermodesulfobacteriota bacterium]